MLTWRDPRDKPISIRHELFAMRSVLQACRRGSRFIFYTPPLVWAYKQVYASARSRAGARASTSRLLKREDVRAVRRWYYAKVNGEIPRGEDMPRTPRLIDQRLREAGSRFAPRW